MQKKYKRCLIIIVVLLVLFIGIAISKVMFNHNPVKPANTKNVISNIEKFGYTLDDRDTKYMQTEFNNLKEILNKEEIDYEKYATSLAKLFVIDFYTLNNKINKYDVGSLEYIYEAKKNDFNNKAMDTIYNDIIDNTYKDRLQDLPEITNVEVISTELTNISLNNTETESYKVTMKYTYKEDFGYDKEGTVYLVRNNDKLEVALYKPEIEINDNENNN